MKASIHFLSIGLLLIVLVLAVSSAGPVQAQEPDMTYVGLKEHGLYAVDRAPDGRVIVGSSNGVWQVTADGQRVSRWSGVGLPPASCSEAEAPADGSEPCFVRALAVSSRGDVFAVVSLGSQPGRLYRWRAGGESWEAVPEAQMNLTGDDRVGMVAVAPDDTLYATATFWYRGTRTAVRRSTDGGETWSEVQYAGDDYWETDDGLSWQPLTPTDISQDLAAIAVSGDNHICYGTLGNILCSTDGGMSWAALTFLVSHPPTFINDLLVDSSGHLWATTDSRGLTGSSNAGLYRSALTVGSGPQPPGGSDGN
jgi:photosystem II stability/assembly factor-like uncharacterized protein